MATNSHPTTLARFLDGEFGELKQSFRKHIDGNSLFKLRYNLSIKEHREITLERAKYLFATREIKQQFDDQAKNAKNFINKSLALGEVVSTTDLSVGVKMGVMGWLFGGAVQGLGNDQHIVDWFQPLQSLQFTGMFCMSERGHGSNVRGIETTAHYDAKTQEFIINTPNTDARKIYIGNTMYGEYATVFAQLYIKEEKKGPHCFIVPIRDQHGNMPGVTTLDMGPKEGLNGVDNGIISFDHVRIPRINLLNRYADVSPEGEYMTSIQSDGQRFNTVIGALLGTRIALCFQGLAALKIGLEIAIKYGLRRRQFGPPGEPEQLLLDYTTHQVRLMPLLATSLALTFAARYAGRILDDAIYNQENVSDNRRLQAVVAGLKAYSSWEAVQGLQTCRETTGGMGFMEVNRIASLKRDSDVFVTFEGDNVVMLQQVVKELLVQYSQQHSGNRAVTLLSATKDSVISYLKTSPLAITTQPVTNPSFVVGALAFKEDLLLRNLAARLLNKVSSQGEPPFEAWNECLDHTMSLAWCHIQRVALEQNMLAVKQCPEPHDRIILEKFCCLYAVHLLHQDRAWFLEQNYITASMSKEIRDKYLELCKETRVHALEVVEAFCHPANCVAAPIAGIPNPEAEWAYYPDQEMTAPTSKL